MALRLGTINTGAIPHVPLTMEGEGESHDAADGGEGSRHAHEGLPGDGNHAGFHGG